LILSTLAVLSVSPLWAQRICATVEYNNSKLNSPAFEHKEDFEIWMSGKHRSNTLGKQKSPFTVFKTKALSYKIPVVVHVIHNGELIGLGANITDDQILSQIAVLNEDLRKLNADTADTQPPFKPVAADFEVDFVMAKQDPDGLPTNGIIRVQGNRSSWGFANDSELKAESYWPAEDYMNIWVTKLSGGLLGWAQFPVSSLEGLEDASTNRLTDGIVIGHQYFGSIEKDPNAQLQAPWNLGRSTTHEVGHFLGLRHIWGDGDCGFDDFVNDTPFASIESLGCPTTKSTCGTLDMFQNYMDYTDDACMNIFTEGQKIRVHVVMDNSPRRITLPTSNALDPPSVTGLDLGVKNIIEPTAGICGSNLIPQISVKNFGADTITNFQMELWVNNQLTALKTEIVSLATADTILVVFNNIPTPVPGLSTFEFRITQVNFTQDGNPLNDIKNVQITIPELQIIPYQQPFAMFPSNWEINNVNQISGWNYVQSPSWVVDNNSMSIDFSKSQSIGETSTLTMPVVDITNQNQLWLQFDRAYRFSFSGGSDNFKIEASTNCGVTYDVVLYNKSGQFLSTTYSSDLNFIPTSRQDWKRELIDLTPLLGNENLQIRFVGNSAQGNVLYLDNISVFNETSSEISISGLVSPGMVFCANSISPLIAVENTGTESINTIQVNYRINEEATQSTLFNISLSSGTFTDLEIPSLDIQGNSELHVELVTPGITLSSTENTNATFPLIQNCVELQIPLREKFEEPSVFTNWTFAGTDQAAIWTTKNVIESGFSAFLPNFNSGYPGTVSNFVSPVLDLGNTFKASVFFDVSYATNQTPGESLRVLVSDDNGLTYSYIMYEKGSEDLRVTSAVAPWTPNSSSDWRKEYIDLSEFAGLKIRLAFEVISRDANDMYIDNLEFFQDDNPNPVTITNSSKYYPNPAKGGKFNITFNLSVKEDVTVIMMDTMGKIIFSRMYPNTLNQTYPFDMAGNGSGLYIIKTVSSSINESTRLFIDP